MPADTQPIVQQLATLLTSGAKKLCTAESCTGGLIAKTLTDLAGSSLWFDRGFVTYSNQAKTEMLAVPGVLVDTFGAVSEPVANAMARGALRHSQADYAIAVTGIAGPGGGSEDKPVGTVWIAVASDSQLVSRRYGFDGDRPVVRQKTLEAALGDLLALIERD